MVHNKLRNKNGKLLHNYYSAQEGILLKWGTWGFRINVKALIVHMPFSHCFISPCLSQQDVCIVPFNNPVFSEFPFHYTFLIHLFIRPTYIKASLFLTLYLS